MLKHTGQYSCPRCDKQFNTREEIKDHDISHVTEENEAPRICITCDKQFTTDHAIKQHMQSKHSSNKKSFPVGHPQRYQYEKEPQNIACMKCDKVFSTGNEVDNHMNEHFNEKDLHDFEIPRKERMCRYYRRGFCKKGNECVFKHNEVKEHQAPPCRRGRHCFFNAQNRCKFSHPDYMNNNSQQKQTKACRYKENVHMSVFT